MVHNARVNYRNADASGNDKMKRDIVLSDIAKLIVSNRDRVITHLKSVGVKINGTPSKGELAKITAQAMMGSQKFAQEIAKEIVAGTTMSCDGCAGKDQALSAAGCASGWYMNYYGQCIKSKKAQATNAADGDAVQVEDVAKAASLLTSMFGKIFGGKKRNSDKVAAEKENAQAAKDLQTKTETISTGGKAHVMKIVLISTGILLFVSGVTWLIVRYNNKSH